MILEASRIKSVRHAGSMAAHLLKEENEIVEEWEGFGGTLKEDLVSMQRLTELTRGKTGIYHVAIAPRENEDLTRDQYQYAVGQIEKKLGLEGQLRTQTYHVKDGRGHLHVCWSLVDLENRKLLDPKYDYRALQEVAQELEKTFEHEPTRRTPDENTKEVTNADRMNEARTGLSAMARKEIICAAWNETTMGEAFLERIEAAGLAVCNGEPREGRRSARILVVDQAGKAHNLARDIPKIAKAKDLRARLQGMKLRSLAEAQALQEERASAAELKEVQEVKTPRTRHELYEMEDKIRQEAQEALEVAQERFQRELEEFKEQQAIKEAERLTRDAEGKPLTPEDKRKAKRRNLQKGQTLEQMMGMFLQQHEAEKRRIEEESRKRRAQLIIAYNVAKIEELEQKQQDRDRSHGRNDGGRELEY